MHDYLFTDEMKRDFICHPTADAPRFYNRGETLSDVYGKYSDEKEARKYISDHSQYGIRGYLFENLMKNGSAIWFTETDIEAECKYPDRGPCNA